MIQINKRFGDVLGLSNGSHNAGTQRDGSIGGSGGAERSPRSFSSEVSGKQNVASLLSVMPCLPFDNSSGRTTPSDPVSTGNTG